MLIAQFAQSSNMYVMKLRSDNAILKANQLKIRVCRIRAKRTHRNQRD